MTDFNIETYINSLPDTTTKLNLVSRNLIYLPDLSKFKNLQELYCSNNQLTTFTYFAR
uniref:Leucine-rich repeat domain-containing protein n=1 Tax=viral metagenome TaxID=1070528 RepID=A0A6C0ITD6_9ZZZZ